MTAYLGGITSIPPFREVSFDRYNRDPDERTLDSRTSRTYLRSRELSKSSTFLEEFRRTGESSVLHNAVELGDVGAVRALLRHGVRIDARNRKDLTPLQVACSRGQTEIASWLLRYNADTYVKTEEGHSPLHLAVLSESVDLVSLLLDECLDPNVEDNFGNTPLHLAAQWGPIDIVERLVRYSSINRRNNKGDTPLHIAATFNQANIVKRLLTEKADALAKNAVEATPLHVAASLGKIEALKKLLDAGLAEEDTNGCTPLHLAVEGGHMACAELLLEHGADPNACVNDEEGETPLHTAVYNNNQEMVELLLRYGARSNIENNKQNTPLHYAVEEENLEIVTLLLNFNASPNKKNKKGDTPLHWATKRKVDIRLIQALLRKGADPHMPNKKLLTSIHLASQEGNIEALRAFIDMFGAKLQTTATDREGWTAYAEARSRGYDEIADLLQSDPYSESFLAIMSLAQMSGLQGNITLKSEEDLPPIPLEGFHSSLFCKEVQNLAVAPEIKAAFLTAADPNVPAEVLASQVQSGQLTVLNTGSESHSVFVVLLGSHMIVCNRGFGSDGFTLKCYKIDPSKFTAAVMTSIRTIEKEEDDEGPSFFYDTLPRLLSGSHAIIDSDHDATCKLMETLAPKEQKISNCSAASFKTALKAALLLTEHAKTGVLTEEHLDYIHIQSKELSDVLRQRMEENCKRVCVDEEGNVLGIAQLLILESAAKTAEKYSLENSLTLDFSLIYHPRFFDLLSRQKLEYLTLLYPSSNGTVYRIPYNYADRPRIEALCHATQQSLSAPLCTPEILLEAISTLLQEKLARFSLEEKTSIYRRVYQAHGSPPTDDPNWGEHNAFSNWEILNNALDAEQREKDSFELSGFLDL